MKKNTIKKTTVKVIGKSASFGALLGMSVMGTVAGDIVAGLTADKCLPAAILFQTGFAGLGLGAGCKMAMKIDEKFENVEVKVANAK